MDASDSDSEFSRELDASACLKCAIDTLNKLTRHHEEGGQLPTKSESERALILLVECVKLKPPKQIWRVVHEKLTGANFEYSFVEKKKNELPEDLFPWKEKREKRERSRMKDSCSSSSSSVSDAEDEDYSPHGEKSPEQQHGTNMILRTRAQNFEQAFYGEARNTD